jgi:hypothetical protein
VALDKKHALEVRMDKFHFAVWTYCNLAVALPIRLLIVLVEHVIEGLIYALQIKQDAESSLVHAIHYIPNELIGRFLCCVLNEVTPIEDFDIPLYC